MKKCAYLLLVLCLFSAVSFSEVSLPKVFSDHMVLQREMLVPVWGKADAGEAVTVEFGGQRLTTEADADGKWMVKLSAMSAGGPFDLVVQGKNTLTFSNVLVGEVWICSGQSNMEFPLERLEGAREEVKNATNPEIRLFLAPKTISGKPQDDIDASWQVCHPHFADNFSAVAYTFAKYVHREIGVPIGLIQSAYGGSKIEPWMTVEALREVPSLGSRVAYVEGSDAVHRGAIGDALADMAGYLPVAREAFEAGEEVPSPPPWPVHPLARDKQEPTCLFNGMINPLVPFGIRGVLWYQGEANCSQHDGMLYYEKFDAMLGSWRARWGQGDFPFYFVQLAPYVYGETGEVPAFWEAQTACLQIPNTGMAVTVDIGNAYDIHPKNKRDVGKRLALWALAKDYGKEDIVYSGPLYRSMSVEGNKIRLHFDHVGTGLQSRDGDALTWFSVAGADREFVEAVAEIEGESVVVSSDHVRDPVAVRFGWSNVAEPNLSNREGLPASPFRTDSW